MTKIKLAEFSYQSDIYDSVICYIFGMSRQILREGLYLNGQVCNMSLKNFIPVFH
jgi:hypothetical protein